MTTFCIVFYEFYLSMMLGFSWIDQQLYCVCRRSLLIWVCVAMLQLVADDLLQNDFASNMKLLQVNFPCVSVFRIRIHGILHHLGLPVQIRSDPDLSFYSWRCWAYWINSYLNKTSMKKFLEKNDLLLSNIDVNMSTVINKPKQRQTLIFY